jgi:hypothetical protein
MSSPPPCTTLGPQCRELRLTVRIAELDVDSPQDRDALATWLLGHTQHISFGTPYREHGQLLVDAVVRVGCRYLDDGRTAGRKDGSARCRAYGFAGRAPAAREVERPRLRHGSERFTVVQDGRVRAIELPLQAPPRRGLAVLQGPNPCATARCRTADNTVGAACCRDLTLDVVVPLGDDTTEAFLRSRRSPYLCKITRTNEVIMECEVISACGYLEPDGVQCGLHGRVRPDGAPAKPQVCSDWPDFDDETHTGHPGCVFLSSK